MIFLPDVNVWIALTSNRHIHHSLAKSWLESVESDRIAFCRLSELGLLRLLTNPHVMGPDVLSPGQAWDAYDAWRADDRVVFRSEFAHFSERWRRTGKSLVGGPNIWTDAYLAVFAIEAKATIVTFDRSFITLDDLKVKVLL